MPSRTHGGEDEKAPDSEANRGLATSSDSPEFALHPVDPTSIIRASGMSRNQAEAFARRLVNRDNRIKALVACLDIRSSTTYMLHLEEFAGYSRHLADFLSELKSIVVAHDGFFDKFTGDGAIVFWPTFNNDLGIEGYCKTLHALLQVQVQFLEEFVPLLRMRGGLLPREFGLATGLDFGEVIVSDLRPSENQVVVSVYGGRERTFSVGNDPLTQSVTVLGRAVVGAVRMASQAKANRILSNNYPGHRMSEDVDRINERFEKKWKVTRGFVPTKEAPAGQFAYELSYPAIERLESEMMGGVESIGRLGPIRP